MSTSAMHVAKTGLNAQQTKMQIIANNLANVNTNGFKRDRANFESLLYQVMRSGGAQTADGTALTSSSTVGTGVRLVSTQKLYSQGSLISTENSLDIAIDGMGFFQVLMPDGRIGYTRNGAFSRNAEGTLTTPRLHLAAGNPDPRQCHRNHHRPERRGVGDGCRPERTRRGRPDHAGELYQPPGSSAGR